MQRVPAVMDLHILVDMGRMDPRWPLGGGHGCSRAATSRQHNTAAQHGQADWVRISHRGHPECGQVVRVGRCVTEHGGEAYLRVELPDGRRERIPQSWTEDLTDGGSAVPALMFSPSSLRALVRMVREHGRAPSAETNDAMPHHQDLDAPAGRGTSRDDPALGRADAPTRDTRAQTRRGARP